MLEFVIGSLIVAATLAGARPVGRRLARAWRERPWQDPPRIY